MMKVLVLAWIAVVLVWGVLLGKYITTPTPPKITHPTFTQHQQLELRVERLEKIVGLRGDEARKEGLQFKIKRSK